MARPQRRVLGVVFNALGPLDLVVAIAVGAALSPGPLQLIVTAPITVPMGLVPTFACRWATLLHVVSFRLLAAPRPVIAVPSTA